MRDQLVKAIRSDQATFGLDLTELVIQRLGDFYDLVQEHNPLLHLVGPCSPEEFAIRHILESLALLKYLPAGAMFADVGAGAGLPSIPCLLARDDLKAVLIESKEKKSIFLELAVNELGIADRAKILNKQFSEVDPGDLGFITCRALDKFAETLPRLVRWSKRRGLLLFGGAALRISLQKEKVRFNEILLPLSEKRYLFVSTPDPR